MGINEKLVAIQNEIKAPKNQYNSFGRYNYRSCEDICTALKPLCKKHKVAVSIVDQMIEVGSRIYVNAVVTMTDIENPSETVIGSGFAREDESKKGMDGSQITGSASSYARKYALAGLLLLDDNKDSDYDGGVAQNPNKGTQKPPVCVDCGKPFEPYTDKKGTKYTAMQVAEGAAKANADGKPRCKACRIKKESENK